MVLVYLIGTLIDFSEAFDTLARFKLQKIMTVYACRNTETNFWNKNV